MNKEETDRLIRDICSHLNGHVDGGRRNIVAPVCPFCGCTGGKYGVYIGPQINGKTTFSSHCFKCGRSTRTLTQTLSALGRPDLDVSSTADIGRIDIKTLASCQNEDEIDLSLQPCDMPDNWKRCFRHPYLRSRGFVCDDYDYFPVGTTQGLNFRFDDYVVFPIVDTNVIVGYVSRHTWPKEDIEERNRVAKAEGRYQIRRYSNSRDNDFVKLLYNYDMVHEGETETVVLCEGVFDVIALTRKLDLYDSRKVAAVATFGKKVSRSQMLKLQAKGVRNVVVGYDGDAVTSTRRAAAALDKYFNTFVVNIRDRNADFDSMTFDEIHEAFSNDLMTADEYRHKVLNLWK